MPDHPAAGTFPESVLKVLLDNKDKPLSTQEILSLLGWKYRYSHRVTSSVATLRSLGWNIVSRRRTYIIQPETWTVSVTVANEDEADELSKKLKKLRYNAQVLKNVSRF